MTKTKRSARYVWEHKKQLIVAAAVGAGLAHGVPPEVSTKAVTLLLSLFGG